MASVGDLFVQISANAQPALDAFQRIETGLGRVSHAAQSTGGTLKLAAEQSDSAFGRFAATILKLVTAYRLATFAANAYNATAQASRGINPATGQQFGPRMTAAIGAVNNQLSRLGPVGVAATAAIAAGFSKLLPIISRVAQAIAGLLGIFAAWKVILVGIAAVAATTVAGIAGAFKSAQLKESIGAVDAIFKGSADGIKKFADDVSAAFGRSKKEILDSATQIGAILKSQGFTEADAATNSMVLLGTAMELAAQRGTTTATALNAVSAAIRGESDPIERLGISINEALVKKTIEADANLTKLAQTNELAAKAAARLILIQNQSADAFGTMAKESGNLTQQMEKLRGLTSQLFTELGSGFEPVVTAVIRLFNAVMQLAGVGMPSLASGFELVLKPITFLITKTAELVEGINALLGRTAEIPKLGGKLAIPQAAAGDAEMEAFKAAQDKFAAEKEWADRLDALRNEMAEREKERQREIARIQERQFDEYLNAVRQQDRLLERRANIFADRGRSEIVSAADVFSRNLNAGQEDPQLKELKEINQGIKELGTLTGILN